jgi:hypothetical protein
VAATLAGPAAVGHAGDDDGATRRPEADLDPVAGRDLARRLDALAADLDVAGLDELRRRAARLGETRGPEPLVDPALGRRIFGAHVSDGARQRYPVEGKSGDDASSPESWKVRAWHGLHEPQHAERDEVHGRRA